MKILLSYSKFHFDPRSKDLNKKLPLSGSSARVLASSLYKILKGIGEVTYIDPLEWEDVKANEYDLFIGQIQNFGTIKENIRAKRSVLFAVNSHPDFRNTALNNFIKENNLPESSLALGELVDSQEQKKSIDLANHILCVGNMDIYNSYIDCGVSPHKIKMFNYSTGKITTKPNISTDSPTRLLYSASEIGLRKGFDILSDMAIKHKNRDFILTIIGKPSNKHYEKKINYLKKQLGKKLLYRAWVSSETKKYDQLVAENDFIISPSLEEGQLGVAIEAMSNGVVPVVTRQTGIDYSPIGFLEPKLSSDNNNIIFNRLLNTDKETLNKHKLSTLEFYREFHEPYMDNLKETIQSLMTDELYPKFSIVLPIFNKEKTILPLLKLLNESLVRYQNAELHVIFDGCKDDTEVVVKKYFKNKNVYDVTYENTPNIFEVKTNNIGLKKSKGKYGVIIQDDNFIYDRNFLFEAANFLEKSKQTAILGCLAGVNYYPKGTPVIGKGQVALDVNETYWRQDSETDPSYNNEIFQVDACMRGPLIIRKDFMEKHGYLDEYYAPFYMDDIDLAFRANKLGYKTFCMLTDVENKSFTIANYDKKRNEFWEKIMKTNSEKFYDRWKPSVEKDYLRINRTRINDESYNPKRFEIEIPLKNKVINKIKKIAKFRFIFNDNYCRDISNSRWLNRMEWVRQQASLIPRGSKVLDIGAGQTLYREAFAHTKYVTQDFAQTPDFEYGKIDIVSDINSIPLPDSSQDYILCTEVFEHIPEPLKALKEISRLLKPGGKLIFSAPLASGQHQAPYHFYGGYTRYWYQKFFAENKLAIQALSPNGGLNAHLIEMLWRSQPQIAGHKDGLNIFYKIKRKFIQVVMYNYPTIKLDFAEKEKVDEDFTACFFCLAVKVDIE
jgi:GT2 family glycosyltransferase/SAM-dependent methyltransferase/glycosyltransferase involved in cell wall biosynthesis